MSGPILRAESLSVRFPLGRGLIRPRGFKTAVESVSFQVEPGTTLGLVGESGSGKSTLGRAILRLVPAGGRVVFDGVDVTAAAPSRLRALRKDMQMVFQDSLESLNPRMTVGRIVGEPLAIHGTQSRRERRRTIGEMLERVGLSAGHMDRYPHEFSGGQRQRINIARAIILHPRFVVCDEPVSALDVSVQAQVMNLLADLKADFRLTYLFISHNLAVVRHISDRVAVMSSGRIVEIGEADDLFHSPQHSYTRQLLAAIPAVNAPGYPPAERACSPPGLS